MQENFLPRTAQKSLRFSRAFTLLELLISMAIMSLLMLATAQIFSRSFLSYQATKHIESNITDAQFLMNLLAKELRTSTVVFPSDSGSTDSIKFFEHSKSQCVQYRFTGSTIEAARTSTGGTFSSCDNSSNLSGFAPIGIGNVTGSFYSVPSRPASSGSQRMGRVTMTISLQSSDSSPIVLQTTTSLRDYGYVGLQ